MSSLLTTGLVVVVCRISHYSHGTSLPKLHEKYGIQMQNREVLHHCIFDAARCVDDLDVLCKVQIILNFKYL
jgi:hypothetical protein